MGFSGYLNPFTNEELLKVRCIASHDYHNHEMAHQMDLPAKRNAILLAFSCLCKMTIYIFNIRATVMPVRYCLGILEFSNKKSFDQLITTVHPE
jgi:hypothetical protein